MPNTSGGKPAFNTGGPVTTGRTQEVQLEVNADKLQRLREENDVLREELVNIDLRRKVEAARQSTSGPGFRTT
ncbi:MAG: hypothetical protein V4515_14745 [Chloroflexota bacterium]